MAFSDSFLDELVARNDIVDVVSSYVRLTNKGSNLFGLCPFHGEKTPSFSVAPDKQIYYCFGCGKGGGVINFIMEMEQLNYPEAVRFLAKRAGMPVPEDEVYQGGRKKKDRLLALNRSAARYFNAQLEQPGGKAAGEYFARRGLSRGMIRRFGLGAAPDAWDGLIRAMAEQGFEKQELLEAGLAVKNEGGRIYDRFRNRCMFPIIDVRGEVIGFGGRVLDDSLPKYLNSPETSVFNKSRNLFALNVAKKSKAGRIILAEGYMDVLALHQAGFDCAVASLGTSLTKEHAQLLTRYTKEVVIAYDGDGAGQKAAQRAIQILNRAGLSVKVLRMRGAKDPDEFIRAHGADAFRQLLDRSENSVEYRMLTVQSKYQLDQDEQRVEYLKEITELLATLESPVEREVYGARAAEAAGISAETMAQEVKRALGRRLRAEKKKREQKELAPARAVQPQERELRYENVGSALAEEGVLRLLSLDPGLFDGTELTGEDFSSPLLGKAYTLLLERGREGRSTLLSALGPVFSEGEMAHLVSVLQKPESVANGSQALADYIETIQREKMKRQGTDEDALLRLRETYRKKKGYGG